VDSKLEAVSCPSTLACLAVGASKGSDNVAFASAESWDGTSWTVIPPVTPAGAATSDLDAVSCSSATACTAVGFYRTSAGLTLPLGERWDGTGWTLQVALSPAGSAATELDGVSCVSATACTAVGGFVNGGMGTFEEFWDGRTIFGHHPRWVIQATQPAFSTIVYQLAAVSCSSLSDCMAVGYYDSLGAAGRVATWAEHWDGTSWTGEFPDVASSTSNTLTGVSCPSATACTAVGWYRDFAGNLLPLAERWNGANWSLESPGYAPGSGGTILLGVACASATWCIAVGDVIVSPADIEQRTVAESWDGTSWTLGNPVDPAFVIQSRLNAVSCPLVAVCTAVGWYEPEAVAGGTLPIDTLAERYSARYF
jgi:hypothetical protein